MSSTSIPHKTSWLMVKNNNVTEPREMDIVFSRGGGCNEGTKLYRDLVKRNKDAYGACTKNKNNIAMSIILALKDQGRRFMTKANMNGSTWCDLNETETTLLNKVCQALRENKRKCIHHHDGDTPVSALSPQKYEKEETESVTPPPSVLSVSGSGLATMHPYSSESPVCIHKNEDPYCCHARTSPIGRSSVVTDDTTTTTGSGCMLSNIDTVDGRFFNHKNDGMIDHGSIRSGNSFDDIILGGSITDEASFLLSENYSESSVHYEQVPSNISLTDSPLYTFDLSNIESFKLIEPREIDIIFARGGGCNNGTKVYRDLVKRNRDAYYTCPENKKGIAVSIILAMKEQNRRFLAKSDDGVHWIILDDDAVRKKVCQALRENQPAHLKKNCIGKNPSPCIPEKGSSTSSASSLQSIIVPAEQDLSSVIPSERAIGKFDQNDSDNCYYSSYDTIIDEIHSIGSSALVTFDRMTLDNIHTACVSNASIDIGHKISSAVDSVIDQSVKNDQVLDVGSIVLSDAFSLMSFGIQSSIVQSPDTFDRMSLDSIHHQDDISWTSLSLPDSVPLSFANKEYYDDDDDIQDVTHRGTVSFSSLPLLDSEYDPIPLGAITIPGSEEEKCVVHGLDEQDDFVPHAIPLFYEFDGENLVQAVVQVECATASTTIATTKNADCCLVATADHNLKCDRITYAVPISQANEGEDIVKALMVKPGEI